MSHRHPVLRYAVRRILSVIPTLGGVILITFLLFNVVAKSPAEQAQGQNATAEQLDAYDARHHLDQPLILGQWVKLRLMRDWARETGLIDWGGVKGVRYSPEQGGMIVLRAGTYSLPLTYDMSPGRYRFRFEVGPIDSGVSLVAFADGDVLTTEAIRAAPSGGLREATVEVPTATLVDRVALRVPENRELRLLRVSLRRQTRRWVESQLFSYVVSVLSGDFGESLMYGQPVSDVLGEKVWISLSLTVPILVFGTLLGVLFGLVCAAWRNRWVDRALLVLSTALMSINYVVWVIAGQYLLAYKAQLFPLWGYEGVTYLMLPVMIGVVSGLGRDVRFYRTVILDEVGKPYVRTAMAKGTKRARILFKHVLRNSLIPIVTSVSMSVPFLLAGSVMLESFYGIPGLGGVSLNAIRSVDANMLRAIVLIGSVLYQLSNLVADLMYAWLDPRVRLG